MSIRNTFGPLVSTGLFFIFGFAAHPAARQPAASTPEPSDAPLALVRVIRVHAPVLALPPDRPLDPKPPGRDKIALAAWERKNRDRRDLMVLRENAREQFGSAVVDRLRGVTGLTVLADSESEPAPVDAVLKLTIDRVGAHTGASREVWVRAAARLETAARAYGPYYGVGQALSPQWLIKPGYLWTDAEIMAVAARQAARQLVYSLKTGQESLFVRSTRVAVVPAIAPPFAVKVTEGGTGESKVDAALVRRLADVLFQPALTPLVESVPSDEVAQALKSLRIVPDRLWQEIQLPDTQTLVNLGSRLRVDYVFVSRIGEMSMEQRPAVIQQFGQTREGNEIRADVDVSGAMIRTADSKVLWTDRVTGSSVARTQFTKSGPRIRRDAQCLADAARVGYAYLRSSFENYRRRFEK